MDFNHIGGLLFKCQPIMFSPIFSRFSSAEVSRTVPAFIRPVLTMA